MIGREHAHHCVRVDFRENMRGQGYARRCIALRWLGDDLLLRHFW